MRSAVVCAASLVIGLGLATPALATITCSVVSGDKGATGVRLYAEPDNAAQVLRAVPLGDLVLYPDDDLAPTKAEGWVWVRHDETQTDLYQSGLHGWMAQENIADCG